MKSSVEKIYDTTPQAWAAMLSAMREAKKSIFWEVYILIDDETGNQFFDVLMRKARDGVDVKLVVDYWGSFALSKNKINELKQSGIDIHVFQPYKHPFHGIGLWIMSRTHRKLLIVDESIGFVGGVNVRHDMKEWDDIYVSLQGKIVRSLVRSFAKLYVKAGGDREKVLPMLEYDHRVRNTLFDFVYDHPRVQLYSKVKQKYIEALMKAREKVILFSPYYFPDKEFLKAIWEARQRGVHIDLLIPFRTDHRFASWMSYAWFALMKKWGVKIHLLKNMMHGKGMVVDDDEAIIGSSNIEYASFYHNHEVNLLMHDKRMAGKLKRILQRWMKSAKSLDDIKFENRGYLQKFFERISAWLYRLWFD